MAERNRAYRLSRPDAVDNRMMPFLPIGAGTPEFFQGERRFHAGAKPFIKECIVIEDVHQRGGILIAQLTQRNQLDQGQISQRITGRRSERCVTTRKPARAKVASLPMKRS